MGERVKTKSRVHPKETANIISFLTFFYTFPLFIKGYKKDLEHEDLYEVLSTCRSKKLGNQLENGWEIEMKAHKNPSIMRALWKCFGKTYLLFGLMQLVMRTIFVLVIPEALGKLVSFFVPGQTELTIEDAYCYAAQVLGLTLINHLYTQNYMLALTEYAIRVRTALCSLIYRKSLRLTEKSVNDISIGQVVTLMTKDVFAIEMLIHFGNELWIGVFQTGLVGYLIYRKIGVAAFAGIGFFLVVLPVQVFIGKLATIFRLRTSKKTDERLKLTQEILSSIKIIKMYVWEKFFTNRIALSRMKEINAVFILFYMKVVIIVIGTLSSKIAFYLLIMTYVWLGNYITAEIVYFILACFGKLRHVLSILFPLGISFIAEFYATLIRLRRFLEAEEAPTLHYHLDIIPMKDPRIVFEKVNVKIRDVRFFEGISLEIEKGLNVLTGHLGSGKTTFLKTILQNYKLEGDLTVYGEISYASQEPWLFPASIKDNILFGGALNPKRYAKVLEICHLTKDFESFFDKDDTIVGDNGTNLSKGQQARINLARAIYKDTEIYLLDDCLAALDAHVSDNIFKECIKTFLKDKLCILVTNNCQHIEQGDNLLEIKGGKVDFAKFVKSKEAVNAPVNIENKEEEVPQINKPNNNIYKEIKKSGKVDLEVYKKYVRFGGGYFVFSLIILLFAGVQFVVSYSDKLVSNWVTLEQNLSSYKAKNLTESIEFEQLDEKRGKLLNLYTILITICAVGSLLKSLAIFCFNRKSSINLHNEMLEKLIGARMPFFDSHFIGNVLNRFSKDLGMIDDHLPHLMNECFEFLLTIIGVVGLITIVNPMFLIPISLFLLVTYGFRHVYQRTGRSLQRLEASTRSPMVGHLNATLEGLTTIRAFRAEQIAKDEFDKFQDTYTSANYMMHNCSRSLAMILEFMCFIFITLVILRFLVLPRDTTVGNVGLAISQAFHLTGLLQWGIRRWADFENNMTSVERVLEYTEVPQEPKDGKIVKEWPSEAAISYKDVSLSYDSRRLVLKNVTFDVKPKQKIGVVGRTGAGKSSIISTLFRLYDAEGKITIDKENINELSLEFLRSNMSIIPQDPVIFSGTVRENIDPLNKCQDDEIWKIIKATKLENLVQNLSDVVDSTTNFSAGQKQLICLGRALARKNKIIVLDEATANLDEQTDSLIQDAIKTCFSSCTVIVIAHRLTSVLSADIVMVISDGQIVEQGEPKELLENKDSVFFNMIHKKLV